MWYEAIIERKPTDEESEAFAATDLRSSQQRFVVRYKSFGQKMTVPIDYIRVTKEQQAANSKRKATNRMAATTHNMAATQAAGGK